MRVLAYFHGPPSAGLLCSGTLKVLQSVHRVHSHYRATQLPIVKVEMSPGRTHEQKAKYVEEVTRLTSEVLKCPIESIDVMFIEVDGTNWAHAGKFYSTPKA
jgi:4-oxalocrotonate tautomerase